MYDDEYVKVGQGHHLTFVQGHSDLRGSSK